MYPKNLEERGIPNVNELWKGVRVLSAITIGK
jgi:hypothetical protein